MNLLVEATAILSTLDDKEGAKSLVDYASEARGSDASPRDIADDELGCAESVTNIIKQFLPDFPIITGTWTLWDKMDRDSRFERVTNPKAGDIIISPTGSLRNAPFPGHVGIMADDTNIMANDSATGLWKVFYTIESWSARWEAVGFPVYFYRIK